MRYLLGISVLVWFNLHLCQAALEHKSGAIQEELTGHGYPSQGTPQDAICTLKTYREFMHCLRDLTPLAMNGFPWALADMTDQARNQQNQSRNLGDPLDPINLVCNVFGDFLKCLHQYAIPSECMVAGDASAFITHTVFQFICHVQPRNTDLLHSLQCLKESRVVDLLVFYLADRTGTHVDDMAQGNVNALFRFMNSDILFLKLFINPYIMDKLVWKGLICLPEGVLYHDVTFIVDR